MKAERRTRTLEYLVYVTSDGKEFDSPKAAEKHEAELLPKKQIPRHYIYFNIIDSAYVYKIESEEDLEYLDATEWNHNAYWTYNGPDWYMAIRNDGGDYPDSYDVFYLKNFLSDLESDVNKLKNLEE
jgi:hypothetical protein